MRKRILFAILMICALTTVAVYSVFAQETTLLGIRAGDNFTYSFEVFWAATDPNKVVPQEIANLNQTHSIHINVTGIGETTAYLNITYIMRDVTQESRDGFIQVLTGAGVDAQYFVIAANLTAGDTAYPQSDPEAVESQRAAPSFTIGETAIKTYLGVSKNVNHYAETVTNSTTGDYVSRDAYYDKPTGVLLEMTITHYFASVQETDSEHWKIVQFNSEQTTDTDGTSDGTDGTSSSEALPEWLVPVVIAVVVVIVVLFAATVVLGRRRKPQEPEPMSTSPQSSMEKTV